MTQFPTYHDPFAANIPPDIVAAIEGQCGLPFPAVDPNTLPYRLLFDRQNRARRDTDARAALRLDGAPVKPTRKSRTVRARPPDGLMPEAEAARSERGTTKQAAAILGLPTRTVQHLAARGEIAAAKLGRRWTFDLEKLRRHVKQKERETWASAKRPQDASGVTIPFGPGHRFAGANSDGRFTRVIRRLRGRATKPGASE